MVYAHQDKLGDEVSTTAYCALDNRKAIEYRLYFNLTLRRYGVKLHN